MHRRAPTPLSISALLSAWIGSGTAFAQGQLWTVGGPGADFFNIQSAVDAAGSGDVILVNGGQYLGFAVDGKGLAIVEQAGADVLVRDGGGLSRVANLPAGETVLLRGLAFETNPFSGFSGWEVFGPSLTVENNAGEVRLEDCELTVGHPCLAVAASSVALSGCSLTGGSGGFDGNSTYFPSPAVEIAGGSVYLYDGQVTGGRGRDAFFLNPGVTLGPQAGEPGVVLEGGLLFAGGSDITGGRGGDGLQDVFQFCIGPSPGGSALWLKTGAPAVWASGSTAAAGEPGTILGTCPPAPGVPAIELSSGSYAVLPGSPAGLDAGPPVQEGDGIAVAVQGSPQELALLAYDFGTGGLFSPALGGALLLAPTFELLFLGPVSAAGTAAVSGTAGTLPPGVEQLVLHLQAATCDPVLGQCQPGAAGSLVILEATP